MLIVHVLQSVIGDTRRQTVRFTGTHDNPPRTVGDAIDLLADPKWRDQAVAWVNEERAQRERALGAGDCVVIAPQVLGDFGTLLLAAPLFASSLLAGAVYGFLVVDAYKKLFTIPNLNIEAGDERSPTYAWDGIRTNYGTGFGITVAYGRHALGGQAISVAVAGLSGTEKEVLDMTLHMSEGRCHSIGTGANKVYGDIAGEANFIGNLQTPGPPIPTGLKANGNLLVDQSTKLWIRMGETGQTPMPSVPGPAKTDAIGEPLDEDGTEVIHTVNEEEVGGFANTKLVFPAGLYEIDGGGNQQLHRVTFRVSYRRQGETAWKFLPGGDRIVGGDIPRDYRFSAFASSQLFTNALGGPWEIRVQRIASQGQGGTPISSCVLEQAIYYSPHAQNYQGSCVINIRTIASETLSGGNPNWHIVGEWRRVRVYDDLEGLSEEEYWDLPTSGPLLGMWVYPPGRNPAWICMDALTSGRYGLGKYYKHSDLDLEAFRDWADLCDETVIGPNGNEARYTFDGPCDNSGASAWDEIQRIARCGRAVIVPEGNKLVPKFEYRDAFGRGGNAVPARVREFLITDANQGVEVQIQYLNPRDRATVVDVQFLNEDLDYEQDLLSVEDPDAEDLNAPFKLGSQSIRRETENLMGCVRPSQARRHALYRHEVNRLAKTTISARAPLEHLGMSVGSIVGYQCSVFRPYDQPTFGLRATVSGVRTGAAGIKLDGSVTIDAAGQFAVTDVSGTPKVRTITNGAGTYAAGTTLTFTGGDIEIPEQAPVAVGYGSKVLRDYVITSVSVDQNLMRTIEGIEWVPSAHDDATTPPGGPDDPAMDPGSSDASQALAPAGVFMPATSVSAFTAQQAGSTAIAVERPDGYRGRSARIYLRSDPAQLFTLLGETQGSKVNVPRLAPHKAHELAVMYADSQGNFAPPSSGNAVVVTPGEFPGDTVPAVSNFKVWPRAEGLLFTWDPLDGIDYYEIRLSDGPHWLGARVVAKTRQESALVGAGAGVVAGGSSVTGTYIIRARAKSGLYSAVFSTLDVASTSPQNVIHQGVGIGIASGTGVGCSHSGGVVTLDAGEVDGTWTLNELDLTEVADWMWLVHVLHYWTDTGTTVDELLFSTDSGEAAWWTLDGRDPTPAIPGADFDLEVATATLPVESYNFVSTTTGQHARIDIEVRYYNGSWTAWQPYTAQRWIASKCQVRARLRRWDLRYQPQVTAFNLQAAYGDGTRL